MIVLFISLSSCGGAGGPIASVQRSDNQESLRRVILNQPDFTAIASSRFTGEALNESKLQNTSHTVSKKGPTYRRDRGVVISYERANQSALLYYPRSHEYIESPRLGVWLEDAENPSLLAQESENLSYNMLGETELAGRRCAKIGVTNKADGLRRIIYYVASNLRNLVVRIDIIDLSATRVCMLDDISFDVPSQLFVLPSGYKKSVADPTAEYRLIDHFQINDVEPVTPESFKKSVLEQLPSGTSEEQIYQYLENRLGNDRLSSYHTANERGEILCRIEYDPMLPGFVKKHFAVVLTLDQERKLKDIRLKSWVTGL